MRIADLMNTLRWRRSTQALCLHGAADAWPLLGIGWEGFEGTFLRGKPSSYPHLESIPVGLPLPPTEHGGSIYETQTLLKNEMMAEVR